METEGKLRLEDLRMEESSMATAPVKVTEDGPVDGIEVVKPTVETPDVPTETSQEELAAGTPETAVVVEPAAGTLETAVAVEPAAVEEDQGNAEIVPSTDDAVTVSTASCEPCEVTPNDAEAPSPVDTGASPTEATPAEEAKSMEPAIEASSGVNAAEKEQDSDEAPELKQTTAVVTSAEEPTTVVVDTASVVDEAKAVEEPTPIVEEEKAVEEPTPVVEEAEAVVEPVVIVEESSPAAPNADTAQAVEEETVPVVDSSAETTIVESTQSVEEKRPEYRPDPPSEHEDEEEDHTISEHEAPMRTADVDDEIRVKDASTVPSDVKPDPPQIAKPKESEPAVAVVSVDEETAPPIVDTAPPSVETAPPSVDTTPQVVETAPPIVEPPSPPVADPVEIKVVVVEEPSVFIPEQTVADDMEGKMVDIVPMEETGKLNTDNDDESYEEIIVDDDDEFIEYVDEILEEGCFDDDDDEEVFTEVTYDSQDLKDQNLVFGNNSRSSLMESRPVIKSATQKALEEEVARKRAEADEAQRGISFRIARQSSFSQKDEEFQRKLQVEEAEHIRLEEERERQRILEQERVARIQAEEAAKRIAQQSEEALRTRLEEEEAQRKAAEAEEHRRAALAAAKWKEAAEKSRREAEEAERNERDARKRAMEEEVRLLEIKLAEAKIAADEAKRKEKEEKKRLQAKIDARRKEKKQQRMSITSQTLVLSPIQVSRGTVAAPSSPMKAMASPIAVPQSPAPMAAATPAAAEEANGVYYTVDELRRQTVPGLDYKNREIYIHPNDYSGLFGMSKAEFDQQPKWKKTQLKRKQKLF